MTTQEMEAKIQELDRLVKDLQKRISQENIRPATVKARHIGEGVPFVQAGLVAARPTTPPLAQSGMAIYFATDTFVLSISTGLAWKTVTLS